MDVKKTPLFSTDAVIPGSFYFALLTENAPEDLLSFWIVMRCANHLLPEVFLRGKELNSRKMAFWIVGRRQFVWLSKEKLFVLHESQKQAYDFIAVVNNFSALYDIVRGAGKERPFDFFRKALDETALAHINAADDRAAAVLGHRPMPDDSLAEDDSIFVPQPRGSPDAEDLMNSLAHKRQKLAQDSSHSLQQPPSQSPSQSSWTDQSIDTKRREPLIKSFTILPSIPQSQEPIKPARSAPKPRPVKIKTEEEITTERQRRIMAQPNVTIYFGQNASFEINEKNLHKSGFLAPLVSFKQAEQKYVTHPQLLNEKPEDFRALLEFMEGKDYEPFIDRDREGGRYWIRGYRTERQYSNELVRAGRLHVLAGRYQVENMQQHIYQRVICCHSVNHSLESVIKTARIVFQQEATDPFALHTWLIHQMANNFQAIMEDGELRAAFWALGGGIRGRELLSAVYEECARLVPAVPTIVIDD